MKKNLVYEKDKLLISLKSLDIKTVIVFFSSIILITISWYYSNPKYFNEIFNFHRSFDLNIESLFSFSYWFVLDTILFLIIPIIIIKFLLREKIINYGIGLGNKNLGFTIAILSIGLFLPIILIISSSDNFVKYFPLMESAKDNYVIFITYEILFLLFIFSWEFIFRGFMLFGLEKKFGLYAIFIQMIPFVILHNGKPFIETFASIFGALFLGYLALRTRSIFYGFIIHAIILISLDLIAYLKA